MNLLFLFTYNVSLQQWDDLGLLEREISLYNQLSKKGINFKFLTYGDNKDLKFNSTLGKISILPIYNHIKSKSSILMLLKSLFLAFKLKKFFKNIDIIKTNQISGCWIGILAKILYNKKLIVRAGYQGFRNYVSLSKIQLKKNYLIYLTKYIYFFITEFIAYKLADRIILTNKSDIDFIINTFKLKRKTKKIYLFHNFIDTNLFKPLNLEKKDKHILFIGRLSMEKNLFNLLKAMKNLKGFTLDVIGSGPYDKVLKEKVKELDIDVNFFGIISNKRIPKIINQYQIFILPSFYECNPKTLLEAMSCEIPCIGTNVRGINDIILHKKNGYLCETNSNSIRDAIFYLYYNNILRKKIGKNARQFILKNCSLNLIVNKEYNLYKEIFK